MSTTWKKEDGDVVFTALGRPQEIEGEEKFAQDVGDAFLAEYDPARGTGSELAKFANSMSQTSVMPIFGEAFLARTIEDTLLRFQALQARDPNTSDTERIDPSRTKIEIRYLNKKTFLFMTHVAPMRGNGKVLNYRVRNRQQYPGRDARSIFPSGIVTDDSVP